MKENKKKIGEMLIETGHIDELQLSSALGEQKQWGGKLGSILLKLGFVNEKTIVSVLEKQLGQESISLDERIILPDVLKRVRIDIAKKYCIIPIDYDKGTLSIATTDPTDLRINDELGFLLGVRIKPLLALESGIRKAIALHYEGIAHEGKTYKSVIYDSTEKIKAASLEPHIQYQSQHENAFKAEAPPEKKEITPKMMIEAIIALLIEKGIITKEELLKKVREKS